MNVFGTKKKDNEPGEAATVTVAQPVAEETTTTAPAAPASRSMYPPFPEGRPARTPRTVGGAPVAAPHSTLNPNLTFEGDLKFQGTVVIDCTFKGKISTEDSLVIGSSAKVQADLTAGTLEISGKVQGDIHARQNVRILAGGEVYGNIETPTISMAEGVVFEGTCTRVPAQPKPQAAPPARPAAAAPAARTAGEPAMASVKPGTLQP
jgi:cytoskeletal protein CcmA (bactofilin family)